MTEQTFFIEQQTNILLYVKKIIPPLPPSSPMAAKNITSPIAIFDPCTHGKKFFTPSTKKVVPMCEYRERVKAAGLQPQKKEQKTIETRTD